MDHQPDTNNNSATSGERGQPTRGKFCADLRRVEQDSGEQVDINKNTTTSADKDTSKMERRNASLVSSYHGNELSRKLNDKQVAQYGACSINGLQDSDDKLRPISSKSLCCPCDRVQAQRSLSTFLARNNKTDDNEELEAQKTLIQRAANAIPCFGIILALFASLFLGTAGMLVKMTHSVNGIQVAVFRALLQLLIYGLVVSVRGIPLVPKRNEYWAVFGRALMGATSITFSYYALKLIPLGDATTIRFSLPIWTLIISYLVLGEPCSLFKVGAVVVSIVGVVLIAKPDSCLDLAHFMLGMSQLEAKQELTMDNKPIQGDLQLRGSLIALASSICLAVSLISLRLCRRTATEVIIVWLSAFSILVGSVTLVALNEWRLPDNWHDVLLILLNGICGSIGQWFITSALKVEQSGVISLARTFDIQVAFFYSAFILHEQIQSTSIVGSVLVSGGVIAVMVPKWLESRRKMDNSEALRVAAGEQVGAGTTVGNSKGTRRC